MAARYLKPQTPLEQGTDYVYPVTTLDQVIGSDGSTRLNTEVESIKSDIATIETSSTAAHSYAIGQYLVYNNTLYKATKAISVGATLVVGNNIQAISVGTELKSLNDSLSTLLNRMGDMSFIRSNVYQDYDSKIDGGVFKVLYGICDLAGVSYFYISFDVHWVRLQFRTNSTSGLQYRVLYGNSVGNWYTITKS